jgi:hypothetical protein
MNRQIHTVQCGNGSTAFLEAHRGIVAAPGAQLGLDFYAGSPDPAGHAWRAFTLDTKEEEAAAAFLRRYGRTPEFVFESRGLLLAGPIPWEVIA